MKRTMTITMSDDWKSNLRHVGHLAQQGIKTGQYQGEFINFNTPTAFFGQLTAHRWHILTVMLGCGMVGVRELARRIGRDPKRTHVDANVLVHLGLLEKTEKGALCCPYDSIHIDMNLAMQSPVGAVISTRPHDRQSAASHPRLQSHRA